MGKLLKIGVALGGGGARGLAHLGVLHALDLEGIPIDLIAGTSMGAIVGGVYALEPQGDRAFEHFQRYLESEEFQKTNPEFLHEYIKPSLEGIFHRFTTFIRRGYFYTQSLTRKAPISEESFSENINFLIGPVMIEETRIPLAVVALDLKTGREVVLKQGSLRKAVGASSAIPGILPPVEIDGQQLVDGGWIDRVPVAPLRQMGADLIIAVDVAEELQDTSSLETGLDIVLRTYDICQHALCEMQLREADVVLRPDVAGIHWSDFGHLQECLQAGEKVVADQIEEIRTKIKSRTLNKRLKKILSILPLMPKK
jgi:NTE family protein